MGEIHNFDTADVLDLLEKIFAQGEPDQKDKLPEVFVKLYNPPGHFQVVASVGGALLTRPPDDECLTSADRGAYDSLMRQNEYQFDYRARAAAQPRGL